MAPSPGYPKNISIWSGLPANLDTAFALGKDEHLYFIKGQQYWKYNTRQARIELGYPKSISLWKGFPESVDAALRLSNGRSYVFKNMEQWRLNDKTKEASYAGKWLYGCLKKSLPIPQNDDNGKDIP